MELGFELGSNCIEVGDEEGIGDGVRVRVAIGNGEIGGSDKFRVKARNLGTWRRGPETQPHLVWKVPVQPLGMGQ